jgi:hypothetical protein
MKISLVRRRVGARHLLLLLLEIWASGASLKLANRQQQRRRKTLKQQTDGNENPPAPNTDASLSLSFSL